MLGVFSLATSLLRAEFFNRGCTFFGKGWDKEREGKKSLLKGMLLSPNENHLKF